MADLSSTRYPAFASDDWMFEQQVRAEVEAEAWRRLRAELGQPPPPPAAATTAPETKPQHDFGGAVLKGLVRFGFGAFGGYLGFIAAIDSGLGEFEAWLAVGAGFVIALSLTAFGPGRRLVAGLAAVLGWTLVGGCALGAVWLIGQMSA